MKKITRDVIANDLRATMPTVSKNKASNIVNGIFKFIEKELREGRRFPIQNVGRINVRVKKERPGRNFHTGEISTVSARLSITCTEATPAIGDLSSRLDFYQFLKIEFNLSKRLSKSIFSSFIAIINSVFTGDFIVEIRGFGTFEPRVKKMKKVRNPRTGTESIKAPCITCHFRASTELRHRIEDHGYYDIPTG